MSTAFKVGDHVGWNSEAGHVSGRITAIHTQDFDWKGYTHRATAADPQYEIKSDKTDHVAVYKGAALEKLRSAAPRCAQRPCGGAATGALRRTTCWRRANRPATPWAAAPSPRA